MGAVACTGFDLPTSHRSAQGVRGGSPAPLRVTDAWEKLIKRFIHIRRQLHLSFIVKAKAHKKLSILLKKLKNQADEINVNTSNCCKCT